MNSMSGYVEMTHHSLVADYCEFIHVNVYDTDGNEVQLGPETGSGPVKLLKDDFLNFFELYEGYYQFNKDVYYPYFFDFVNYEERAKFHSTIIQSNDVIDYICEMMETCLDVLNQDDVKVSFIIQRNEQMKYHFGQGMISSCYLGLRLFFTDYDNLIALKLLN